MSRSSSRNDYYKLDNVRKRLVPASSPSRYDRDKSVDDDSRDSLRLVRKRTDYDFDSFDRRKGLGSGFDRYPGREGYNSGGGGSSSDGVRADRAIHRSESFSGPRREFPKGFRSERDRARREGSVSSWRRFGCGIKDFEESKGSRTRNEERMAAAARFSPKGFREAKSPTWSRDSGSDQSKILRGSDKDEGKGRSSTSKLRSSPTWSKESGSEQSKSVEVGKRSIEIEAIRLEVGTQTVEMEVKSIQSHRSSEMEEGELEPEPGPNQEVVHEDENGVEELGVKDAKSCVEFHTGVNEREDETANTDGPHKASMSESNDVEKAGIKMLNRESNVKKETSLYVNGLKDRVSEGIEEGNGQAKSMSKAEDVDGNSTQGNGFNLEPNVEEVDVHESTIEVVEDNTGPELNANLVTQNLAQNLKGKGKSMLVSPDRVNAAPWTETEPRGATASGGRDDDMEGPSIRGFELFSRSSIRIMEKEGHSGASKQKDEKRVLEPLDLSLSLPNVLVPIGAPKDTTQTPGSPSHARSFQSFNTFRTNSDGLTASISCSGSQALFHNPSCSLTHNSLDLDNCEQSVHSRPLFQGIDWQTQNQNDPKHKETSSYQKILMNGNGSLHQSMPNGQAVNGSFKMSNGNCLGRQMNLHKQLSGVSARNYDDTRSQSQSLGCEDLVPTYSPDKKRAAKEKHSSSLYKSNTDQEERFLIGGADFVETVISRIVSDPIHVMARKFNEMTAQSGACLKESICEIMLNAERQGQLCAFQTALHNRSDLTLDALLKSHKAQLEILVALRTGLVEYLKVDNGVVSSSDLAEVFLNLRCRNLTCRSLLPVDECDCKVCSKKNGFCSTCMCLVCSKFDMASNTCSWVGCDVCLHWCHADCALRESYIRNGRSPTIGEARGETTEMQFHCVACDHPSEMFGFVKEVFQNFAKEWTAETLCKELEYVKRIFRRSKDVRGRRLHEIADQMLAKMANKSNLRQVHSYMIAFLTDGNASKLSAAVYTTTSKEQGNGSISAGPTQDGHWRKSTTLEKGPKLERSSSLLLPTALPTDLNDKHPLQSSEIRSSSLKEPVFDELEGIVRIKLAEAQMFQSRADDARREAEGLKRIATAKNEKIEEEYASRIAKLRVVETEEVREQKLQEFQTLERAHREYFGMKMRMEADIKDLLLKMEATKRNLAM